MTFALLALVCLVALAGPALALNRRLGLPVVAGELAVGLVLGTTGLGVLDHRDETFAFLAQVGFALVMFTAGTHLPVRASEIWRGLRKALVVLALVVPVALGIGLLLGWLFHTPHWAIYGVLLASSSSALIVPVLQSGQTATVCGPLLSYLPQVALADALCILAIPLAVAPSRVVGSLLGAGAVLVAALAAGAILWWVERSGWRRRVHDVSEERSLAIELRVVLVLLFAMAALAVWAGLSVMLAGFALGAAVSFVGPPRRVAKQVFALTEGFFGPIFFVWFGAGLDLRQLGTSAWGWALAGALLLGTLMAHGVGIVTGQPWSLALMASAQMGVPVALTTLALGQGAMGQTEAGAIMLACAGTVAVVATTSRPARRAVQIPEASAS